MKTNRIMDEIRSTISPEMKLQMENLTRDEVTDGNVCFHCQSNL